MALKAELEDHDEAQMRAAKVLRARVPVRIALILQDAFRAVRAAAEIFRDRVSGTERALRERRFGAAAQQATGSGQRATGGAAARTRASS